MREVTKEMIAKFNLKKLGIDFMGYEFNRVTELSFHHLIVPRRLCPLKGYGQGFFDWNCAILKQDTAHDYLHIVEKYDRDMFNAITSEMVDENVKGHLDMQNLRAIDDILSQFEKEYCNTRTTNGDILIKDKYYKRIIKGR